MKSFLVDWEHFSSQKGNQRDLVVKVITSKIRRLNRRRQKIALGKARTLTFKNCYPISVDGPNTLSRGGKVEMTLTFEYDEGDEPGVQHGR